MTLMWLEVQSCPIAWRRRGAGSPSMRIQKEKRVNKMLKKQTKRKRKSNKVAKWIKEGMVERKTKKEEHTKGLCKIL